MDVVEKIVEKMKKWDTWDDMEKDLNPYLNEVVGRMRTHSDQSIIYDCYLLELIIIPKVKVDFFKDFQDLCDLEKAHVKGYCDVVADIMKLHRNSDKLNDVVESHPQLLDREKDGIRQDWKKQHTIETEGDENLMVEDSEMRDYLKAKCDELVSWKAKIDKVILQKLNKSELMEGLSSVRDLLRCQRIIRLAEPNFLAEHKKQVQSMRNEDCSSILAKKWGDSSEDKAKDNSCSSTQAKKWGDSSEDNICRPKKPKLDEC